MFPKSKTRVMVWGCIAYNAKGPLIFLDLPGGRGGGLTGPRYIEQVLGGPFLAYYRQLKHMHGKMWFEQDRVGCHRAIKVMDWLQGHGVDIFPQPPSSPDVSPIEPLWLDLKKAVAARPHRPSSPEQLIKAIAEEWERLPIEKINHYIESMPRRIAAVLAAKGRITHY